MAFNFAEFNHFLSKIKDMDRERASRILYEDFMTNKDFGGALFNPSDTDNIAEYVSQMYQLTSKPKVMKAILDVVADYGPEKFDRWVATWIFSIASFNLDAANASVDKINEDADRGNISKKERERELENVDRFMDLTGKLNKYSGKIVKSTAKIISKKSGLDKEFVKYALKTNPNPKFINSNRIGFYLNQLLNELYTELDIEECSERIEDIDWKYFFREIYGRENILDVATFILLEGAHRTKGFKTQNVRKIWDSLTAFALDQLENADAPARTQMIELYLKRIEKMFANGSFDLRVDLRSLPNNDFPKLTSALEKYTDRINKAFSVKTTENA